MSKDIFCGIFSEEVPFSKKLFKLTIVALAGGLIAGLVGFAFGAGAKAAKTLTA